MKLADFRMKIATLPERLRRVDDLSLSGLKGPGGLICGCGALTDLAGRVRALLSREGPILIVADPVVAGLGWCDLAEEILARADLRTLRFAQVEAEPSLETASAVVAMAAPHAPALILGIGGGSAMDVAKIAALALGLGCDARDVLAQSPSTAGPGALPLILVPTTAGTGSEVSLFAVATAGSEKRSLIGRGILPELALIDPMLSATMPASVTAMTGMDALTHAIEAMMHVKATPLIDGLALGAVTLIGRALRRACQDGSDMEARHDMAVAAALSMIAFNQTGGLWAHSVSYLLGEHCKAPHGLGCALGLAALMRYNEPVCGPALRSIAAALQPGATEAGEAAGAVTRLMHDIGLPGDLSGFGLPHGALSRLASEMLQRYPRAGNPRPMDATEAIGYWHDMAGLTAQEAG
ncbi:iron-containing alcohol dehydrogenase [Pseudogemmobacter humi]|uniref:Alcohol dehydrogenase 2 n=1 Tax=Pseudogemmobacter humi TaxID=2483812 RepID=A0A3P5X7V5_9RHOB|nr:iron-containing alcohol dehydrogenase [Pseudogemmobacter humi]VDC30516.1 Alcohol dehydrogenase 2 [Pseudogemmobacter humi]